MRIGWRVVAHVITVLVSGLRGCTWGLLVLLSLLVCHSSCEVMQKFHLSCEELLHCWIWWWGWQQIMLIHYVSTPRAGNILPST